MTTPNQRLTGAEIEAIIGDPKQVDAELQKYRKDTRVLSRRLNLVSKYPKRWIAVYDGEVRADSLDLNQLMDKIDDLGLPRDRVVVRFVDRNLRRMIL